MNPVFNFQPAEKFTCPLGKILSAKMVDLARELGPGSIKARMDQQPFLSRTIALDLQFLLPKDQPGRHQGQHDQSQADPERAP